MKIAKIAMIGLSLVMLLSVSVFADKKEEVERAKKAATAFKEIMDAPDQAVPQELLDRAYCVASC